MATFGFEVVIHVPRTSNYPTAGQRAKTHRFTNSSGNVIRLETETFFDALRAGHVILELHDPGGELFDELPDPTFQFIRIEVYLTAYAAQQRSGRRRVFDGMMDQLSVSIPGPDKTRIVGYDWSIELRRANCYKVLKNLDGKQLVDRIARDYGLSVTADDFGSLSLSRRELDIGASVSAWEQMNRALAVDGLAILADPTQERVLRVMVAERAIDNVTVKYPKKLTMGDPIKRLNCSKRWLSGGHNTMFLAKASESRGVAITKVRGSDKTGLPCDERVRTESLPPGYLENDASKTLAERHYGQLFKNEAEMLRARKDTLTLECVPLADLSILNYIELDTGKGIKIDGDWYPRSVSHLLASGHAPPSTRITATRWPAAVALNTHTPFANAGDRVP
jgi:hypothetical protein